MRSSDARIWLAIAALVALALPCNSSAEEARRDGGEATARLQMMLQQATSEKSQLAAENARLKAERDELKKAVEASRTELATERGKSARVSQDLAGAQTNRASLQQGFDTLKSRFEKLVDQYKKTVEVMRELEADRNSLRTMVSDYDVRVTRCERNNETLYSKNLELIDLYARKGVFASLKEREPVTRIGRAEMENLMQDYRYQADEMRLKYAKPEPSAVPSTSASDPPRATDGS